MSGTAQLRFAYCCGLDLSIHDTSDLRDRSRDLEIDDLKYIVSIFNGDLGCSGRCNGGWLLLWP